MTYRAVLIGRLGFTDWAEVGSTARTNASDVELWEKVRVGSNGHATSLLWADLPDDDAEEEPEANSRF